MRITGGRYKGRDIGGAVSSKTRPTTDQVRESVFSVLQVNLDWEDVRVLDLYSGTGSLALESLSRGAKSADCIEIDKLSAAAIRDRGSDLGIETDLRIFCANVDTFVEEAVRRGLQYELIFCDPPYEDKAINRVLSKAVNLLTGDGIFVAEHEYREVLLTPAKCKIFRTLKFGDTVVTLVQRQSAG